MKSRVVVFDAYGTLFDVQSVVTHASGIDGDLRALSVLWRQRQLECTWLRSLMDRYEDHRSCATIGHPTASDRHRRHSFRPSDECVSLASGVRGRKTGLEVIGGTGAGDPVEWFPQNLAIRDPPQWARISFRRDHFGRSRTDVQTVSTRLLPGDREPAPSGVKHPICVVKRLGRIGRKGIRLPGLLVQQAEPGSGVSQRLKGLP